MSSTQAMDTSTLKQIRPVTIARATISPDFIERNDLQGMAPGAPGGVDGDAARMDREASDVPCPCCGREDRVYLSFVHGSCDPDQAPVHGHYKECHRCGGWHKGSYRVFRVCANCGDEEEF
jgi:hypothetical protein